MSAITEKRIQHLSPALSPFEAERERPGRPHLQRTVMKELEIATKMSTPMALAVVALVLMLAGCASPRTKTIQIDSDPQGARVECNNEDLGRTPTTFTLRTNP